MAAEILRSALLGIAAHRLRSGLTILGMMIGVSSVIVLIAVGNGSSRAVQASIESLGTNVLLVISQPGATSAGASSAASTALTEDDAKALQDHDQAPDVLSASPVVNVSSATMVNGDTSYSPSQFVGTTSSYFTAHSYKASSGQFFSGADVKDRQRVAVIGPTVASELFPGQSPVGRTVLVNGVNFQVVGVTESKGSNGAQDQDDLVIAPISSVQDALAGYGDLSSITVQAASQGQLDAAQAEVSSILDDRHGVTDASNPGFQVINQGSILDASSSTQSVFTTLLAAVAAISLLVAGIGVMNIMLVSVTERTREIGIRKAIGARRSDILAQFLTEALLVSCFGGLVGVAAGIIGSQFTIAGVHPIIAPYSIALALAAAALAGVFFGTYPALRAAQLRPVEALRYE